MKRNNNCGVCGARTAYHFTCCDSTCFRAKKNGLTRGEQVENETRNAVSQPIVVNELTDRQTDDLDYNQPYLRDYWQ